MVQAREGTFTLRMSDEEKTELRTAADRAGTDQATLLRRLITQASGSKLMGFTLMELLVVVIIIAILTAIAVPVFLHQREAAWKASVQADVVNARLATESATASTLGAIDGLTFQTGTHESPLLIKAAGDSYKSPVSSGNTITEAIGKTAAGEACYVITGTNKNVIGYEYTKTSNGGTCEESSPNKLVGGKSIFYSLQANGSMKKITDHGTENITAWAGLGGIDTNALGISSNGMKAYAVSSGTNYQNVGSILAYDAKTNAWTRIPKSGLTTNIRIVSGEVDADGNYLYGGYDQANGQIVMKLFIYDAAENASHAIGYTKTGITTGGANGDFSFDADGNLWAVISGSTTNLIKITATDVREAETKGSESREIPSTLRTLETDATNVNGVAFDADGSFYISNGRYVYRFNAQFKQIGGAYSSLGSSTDLARSYGKN